MGVEGGVDRGIRVLQSGEVGQPQARRVVAQLSVGAGEPDLGALWRRSSTRVARASAAVTSIS